ncbi:hypothetical protein FGB62_69g240 [Gracilaria domingensis]|nr:hypothetical protein FGB62_69g240 [Gracilaria domingensis]
MRAVSHGVARGGCKRRGEKKSERQDAQKRGAKEHVGLLRGGSGAAKKGGSERGGKTVNGGERRAVWQHTRETQLITHERRREHVELAQGSAWGARRGAQRLALYLDITWRNTSGARRDALCVRPRGKKRALAGAVGDVASCARCPCWRAPTCGQQAARGRVAETGAGGAALAGRRARVRIAVLLAAARGAGAETRCRRRFGAPESAAAARAASR